MNGSESASLQAGIALTSAMRPLPCYRLVLVNAMPGADTAEVGHALGRILSMLGALTRGEVRELNGQPLTGAANSARQFASLQTLLAYGRLAFDPDHPLVDTARPAFLTKLDRPSVAFPALPWHSLAQANTGAADIAV
ncbi:MAG: hypothetical protein WKF96_12830 [Solirubrobacteraceae bacterium]